MITNRGYRELMLKASKETNFQDPVESLRMKCLSRGASGILGLGSYRTRYCTPRRASARKQKPVKENGMSNTIKTPQTRKMPARQKIANSMKGKNEPPAKVSCNMVTKRCIIQVEPLVLNDVVITPLQTKRRASRSIPEESNVTPKRSKLNSPGNKELKVSVLSLRQSFHMCEVLEKVSESDTGEDASDNQSLFTPSDTSGSSDDDDDDDDDNNDDHSHNDNENDESTNKPGRTLRSAKKKPMFTSIQETPRDMCEVLEKVSESDTEEDSSDNQSLFIPSDTSGSSDDDDDDDDDDYSHNDSEKVSESDTGEDASDNQSLFTPSDTSGSFDDDDDDDDDNNDDHSHNDNENDESTNKPGRTLRSAKKKPMFTSIQETPRDMHEGLGKASESDTEENSSDNRSLFIPSDTSGSSDDDDDDDDDYSHNDSEKDESTNKPGRTLRSAGKKPMFTSVQDTPRGRCRVRRCPTLFGYLPKGSGDRGFTLQEERNRPSGNESRG
ncbi:transcription initiation factor TFIID subunit 11-like isoform X12 [Acropora millepora]|uniref:transcription initiation factor TFIID subunit 11-like isoform X12 n=1 Tax=Acropora millepora TaxID=45264 RepID=UPI001CF50DB2|nr:transcription initiation factor TFIID subunit 11-like isoform X12 [Acropora millepora]